MAESRAENIIGSTIAIIVLIIGLIITGMWIPKAGFLPKRISISVLSENKRGQCGFMIVNRHSSSLMDVVIDVNGKPWKNGYCAGIPFFPTGKDPFWVSYSKLRKDGETLEWDSEIKKVEIYGTADNRTFHCKFLPHQLKRGG